MMALSGSISRWSGKFVLRGDEDGVVNVVSVSSYQRGGGYVDCPPHAKLSGMHVRSLKLKPVHQQALRQLT